MRQEIIIQLKNLYKEWIGTEPTEFEMIRGLGSDRKYFRLYNEVQSAVGVYNPDKRENEAFIGLTNHFLHKKLHVPHIYKIDLNKGIYLIENLGTTHLFDIITEENRNETFSLHLINLFKMVLDELLKFQLEGIIGIDDSLFFPKKVFDQQSMMWDLNYFKYYFLRPSGIHFDELKLDNDFNTLTEYLLTADTDYFMYRDFQSRNILVHDEVPYFIDYQGGRRGALYYDLASLLYQAKARIPEEKRQLFLKYYFEKLQQKIKIEKSEFDHNFYGFVVIRIIQTLGAYGFRGFYERKGHFIASVPLHWRIYIQLLKKILTDFIYPIYFRY